MGKIYLIIILIITATSLALVAGFFCCYGLISNEGTIQGQVTDEKGNPIAGAKLTLDWTDENSDNIWGKSETHSNSQGYFFITCRYGSVSIRAQAPGYAAMSLSDQFKRQNQDKKWNFRLPKSGSVSGRLLDTRGNPVSNRLISLYPIQEINYSHPRFVYTQSQQATDTNGLFEIDNVAPCKNQILTSDINDRIRQIPVNIDFVEAKPGNSLKNVELRINCPEDYAISGTLQNAQGNPIPEASCSISNGSSRCTTDEKGAFWLGGLDGKGISSFEINFHGINNGKYVNLSVPNIPINTKNLTLVILDEGNLHGIVRNAKTGQKITDYQISVPIVQLPENEAILENPSLDIKKNSDGSFNISNIPAGQATVEIRVQGMGVQQFIAPVEAQKTNNIDCDMLGPAILTGKVIMNAKPHTASIVINDKWLHSDENGNFRFDQFPNGEYTIIFHYMRYENLYRQKVVQLKSGQTTHVNVEIGGSCEIRGSIIFPENIYSCEIRLASKNAPEGWSDNWPALNALSFTNVSKSSPQYRLRDLPAGRWYLMVGCYNPLISRYTLKSSQLVELKEGETLSLDLDLTKPQSQTSKPALQIDFFHKFP